MKFHLSVFLTIGAIQIHAQAVPCRVTAITDSGVVCGTVKKATNGDEFASFSGIPYAKAPYGHLRFAEPQKREPFEGVFNATSPGPVCPQRPSALAGTLPSTPMDEDCLSVNIYVPIGSLPNPDAKALPLLPIMVFVHGGSFAAGTGGSDIYGPEYLITKGIMVVTLQYRLNSFGFLNLEMNEIPGNTGIRDIVFALKWIQNNIRNFGGDPEEVTLAGQSAGGALVSLVSVSPAVKGLGLFKRVIALSGGALYNAFTVSPKFSRILTQTFLLGMGIDNCQSKEEIYKELINAPVERILKANAFVEEETRLPVTFSPVIETPLGGLESMIPKDPEDLLKEGYSKEFTTMLGFTNNECGLYWSYFERQNQMSRLRRQPYLIVPLSLFYSSNDQTIMVLTDAIFNKYFNNSQPTLDKFMHFCNDVNFKYPAMRMTRKRLEIGAAPTFIYQFGYHGLNSVIPVSFKLNFPGAIHTEDITYVFRMNSFVGPNEFDELNQADDDSKVRQWMTTAFANFVKTGNPAMESEWLLSGANYEFMNIELPMKPEFCPATPYMVDKNNFFDHLYKIVRGD